MTCWRGFNYSINPLNLGGDDANDKLGLEFQEASDGQALGKHNIRSLINVFQGHDREQYLQRNASLVKNIVH